jgi:hypothetical protein
MVTCGTTPSNAPLGLPDTLPFALEFDSFTGTIRQVRNSLVERALQVGYGEGAVISGAMDSAGIGQRYAEDFLAHIKRVVPSLRGKRILEIGCGTGYLLSLLRDGGADVVGIEPGPHGEAGGRRFGVRILQGFFPHPALQGPFDLVLAYAVLEHLADPLELLDSIGSVLAPEGCAILAVPDCQPYLTAGDLSCLLHQHWSYFTAESLQTLLGCAGFDAKVHPAAFGGSLYCAARPLAIRGASKAGSGDPHSLTRYRETSVGMLNRLAAILQSCTTARKSLGVYVPGRLINALAVGRYDLSGKSVRFFDDNPELRGRFFPGFATQIESWQDYVEQPVDMMLIMSNTFGLAIRQRVDRLGRSEVKTWDELFVQGP